MDSDPLIPLIARKNKMSIFRKGPKEEKDGGNY